MIADVEAEHLFFEGQPECLVELSVGDREAGVGKPGGLALGLLLQGGEERHDSGIVFAAALERAIDDLFVGEEQPLASVAHRVEGAGLDEGLQGPLVQDLGVDPLAEVVEVDEGAGSLPFGHDEGDQGLAHVAHGGQSEGDGPRTVAPGADGAFARGEVRGELGQRAVDVGDLDLDAEGPALAEVDGGLVLVVLDRGQQAGQVLDRVVGLQPGGLIGDEPVAVGVGLVEGVVGEGLDDVEEGRAERLAVAGGYATFDELDAFFGNESPVLLAARLAQIVGLGERVPGELLGHPHDRLLVDHEAVGVGQDVGEVRVFVGDRLAAVLAVGVVPVHVGRHGAGAVQGDQGGDVVERGGGERAHERAHGPALELEHAHGVALAQHDEGGLVIERDVVDVWPVLGGDFDQVEGPLDDREVAQPEEVHLEQPEVFDAVHLVLGDDGCIPGVVVVGLALDGDVLGERQVGDDHGRGMDPVSSAQPLEAPGHVDDALGLGIGLVHGAQFGGGGKAVLESVGLGQAGSQWGVAAHHQWGHGLGDLVADDVGEPEHP